MSTNTDADFHLPLGGAEWSTFKNKLGVRNDKKQTFASLLWPKQFGNVCFGECRQELYKYITTVCYLPSIPGHWSWRRAHVSCKADPLCLQKFYLNKQETKIYSERNATLHNSIEKSFQKLSFPCETHCGWPAAGGRTWSSFSWAEAWQLEAADTGPGSPWRRSPWRAVWSEAPYGRPTRSTLQTWSGLEDDTLTFIQLQWQLCGDLPAQDSPSSVSTYRRMPRLLRGWSSQWLEAEVTSKASQPSCPAGTDCMSSSTSSGSLRENTSGKFKCWSGLLLYESEFPHKLK